MTWEVYTRVTAKARALEMVIAVFVAFWAFNVLTYALSGTGPLLWAGLTREAEIKLTAGLLCLSALHLAGTHQADRGTWPAAARAMAMAGMAMCFAYLAVQGGGTSAAPTYFGITIACLGAVAPAAKDARYARGLHAADRA